MNGAQSTPSRTERATPKEIALAFCIGWAVLVLCQYRAGSFIADYNGFADEPGHVVTGAMVGEFLAQGDYTRPMDFASRYYAHYPKVGMGRWPPGFYAAQAVWTSVCGRGKVSLFLFLSALSAGVGALIYCGVRKLAGVWAATASVLAWCLAPKTIFTVTTVLAEPQLALLCAGAIGAYSAYLDRTRPLAAMAFAAFAAAAFLTKGAGASLALVPPVAILSLRRARLFLRLEFWIPALIVCGAAGVWYGPMLKVVLKRVLLYPHTLTQLERAGLWIDLLGAPLMLAALFGWATQFLFPAVRRTLDPKIAAAGAFVFAGAVFHQLVPESQEARHLAHVSPFAVGFAFVGWDSLLRRLDAPHRLRPVATVLLLVIGVASSFRLDVKPATPYSQVAEDLLADPALVDSAILVSSQQHVEGLLIAELAQRRPDPDWMVLRSGKQLARQGPNGFPYIAAYRSATEVAKAMLEVPVAVIVLEDSSPDPNRGEHHRQLLEVVTAPHSPWKLQKSYVGNPGALVYRLDSESLARRNPVMVEIGLTGRYVEIPPTSSIAERPDDL